MKKKRVAIVGAGISGLGCAYALRQTPDLDITVFEGGDHIGGHSNTVDLTLNTPQGPVTHGVDTGFLVFNRKTYPRLLRLFEDIKVPIAPSEMSFSVSIEAKNQARAGRKIEWAGNDINSLFGQRSNLFSLSFWRMVIDILRFNRLATQLAHKQIELGHEYADPDECIADFLDRHHFSQSFRENYFLPMIGAIGLAQLSRCSGFQFKPWCAFATIMGCCKSKTARNGLPSKVAHENTSVA